MTLGTNLMIQIRMAAHLLRSLGGVDPDLTHTFLKRLAVTLVTAHKMVGRCGPFFKRLIHNMTRLAKSWIVLYIIVSLLQKGTDSQSHSDH